MRIIVTTSPWPAAITARQSEFADESIRPTGPLRAQLVAAVGGPNRCHETVDRELQPLDHSAIEHARSEACDHGGSGGRSDGYGTPLYFGVDRIFLGGSWHFFTRSACEGGA